MLDWAKSLAIAGAFGLTIGIGGITAHAAPLGVTADRPTLTDTHVVRVHGYDYGHGYGYERPRSVYDRYLPLPYYSPNSESARRPYSSDHPYYHSPYRSPGYYAPRYYAPSYHSHYESDRSINRRLRVGNPHDVARCASMFRTYNPYKGTYITYDGEVRMCPFLD